MHHQTILSRSRTQWLNNEQTCLLMQILVFILCYSLLRWQLGLEDATHRSIRFIQNFSNDPLPIVGAIFFPALVSLFFTDGNARKTLGIFLLASTPYWLAMLVVAYPWEIRLWVPIIILMTFIKLAHSSFPQEKPAA